MALAALGFSSLAAAQGYDPRHLPANSNELYRTMGIRLEADFDFPKKGTYIQDGEIRNLEDFKSGQPFCYLRFAKVDGSDQGLRYDFLNHPIKARTQFQPSDSFNGFPSKAMMFFKPADSKTASAFEPGFTGLHMQCTHVASRDDIQKVFKTLATIF
jgi:hypothetical protein